MTIYQFQMCNIQLHPLFSPKAQENQSESRIAYEQIGVKHKTHIANKSEDTTCFLEEILQN